MCSDTGIEGVIITNPERILRRLTSQPVWHAVDMGREPDLTAATIYTPSLNDVDLAESYVPFEPPQVAVTTKSQGKCVISNGMETHVYQCQVIQSGVAYIALSW